MTRLAPTQRPYQEASTAALVTERSKGLNRLLVKCPTGTGKTVWFADLLRHMPALGLSKAHGACMLVVAHREELLDQAAEKIQHANPGVIVSVEQGDRRSSRYSDVIVASVQTLAALKFKRLQKLLHHHEFKIVVVDEAHHAAAKSYRTILAHLGFLPFAKNDTGENIEAATHDDVVEMERDLKGWDAQARTDQLLIGVTATPNRSDAVGLACVFQSIAYNYELRQAIEDGWLVPLRPWVIETSTSLDAVKNTAGDFNQKQLAAAVNVEIRNKLAVAAWNDHARGLSTIAFTVDVQHAHDLAAEFRANGVLAEAISGATPKEQRRKTLADFSAGRLEVITNCMVLTEGTDLPRCSCILHAKPTQSATLYEQMTGRGLRLFPGKTECIVIDLVDVARRHSLMAAPILYGLPPSLVGMGEKLDDLAREVEAMIEAYPGFDVEALGRLTLEQLRAKALAFDPWAIQPTHALGRGRAMDWIKVAPTEYRLQYPWGDGIEIVTIAKDLLDHYDVSLTLRPRDGSAVRQQTLAQQVPKLDEAASIAEKFILGSRRSVMALKSKDAAWKSDPPTEGQIGLLRRIGAPITRNLTKGEASRMISLHQARRGR